MADSEIHCFLKLSDAVSVVGPRSILLEVMSAVPFSVVSLTLPWNVISMDVELILTGKCQGILGNDAGRNWHLNAASLRRSKDKRSGDSVPILVQGQFSRSLPLVSAFVSAFD